MRLQSHRQLGYGMHQLAVATAVKQGKLTSVHLLLLLVLLPVQKHLNYKLLEDKDMAEAWLTKIPGSDKEASPFLICGWGSPALFLLAWSSPSFGTPDPERPAANQGTCQKAAACRGQSSSAFSSHQLTPRKIPVWYVVSSCSAMLI